MALPVADLICRYDGIQTIEFHTYTQSYPAIAPWTFNKNSFEPMEFHGYVANNQPVGFAGAIIDLENGYTPFSVGNVSASENSVFGGCIYQDKTLKGISFGTALAQTISAFEYSLPLGGSISNPLLQFRTSLILGSGNNTGAPLGHAGSNFPLSSGVYTSSVFNLAPVYYEYDAGQFLGSVPPFDLGFGTSQDAVNSIPYNGTNYVQIVDDTSFNNPLRLLSTDFFTYGILYSVTWQNPVGGPDINSIMLALTSPGEITPQGFLSIFTDSITVNGTVLNGYGILIAPDYSSYRILQFIPRDSTSANWTTAIGGYQGKIDSQGALWLKNVNSENTLFVSSGDVVRVLPVYPPFSIPTATDADPLLKMLRLMG